MEGSLSFDVQVLSGKTSWRSVGRHQNPTDARNEAHKLSSTRKYQGVKVIQEHFDYVENKFVEKTIFKQMKILYAVPDPPAKYIPVCRANLIGNAHMLHGAQHVHAEGSWWRAAPLPHHS